MNGGTGTGATFNIDGYAKSIDVNNELQIINKKVDNLGYSKLYRVEIITDAPTVISTESDVATMTCKVYSWDVDITNTLDASLFSWKRISSNVDLDTAWNSNHVGMKQIVITHEDVYESASFTCEVNLPE